MESHNSKSLIDQRESDHWIHHVQEKVIFSSNQIETNQHHYFYYNEFISDCSNSLSEILQA